MMKIYGFVFYIDELLFRPTVYEATETENNYNLTFKDDYKTKEDFTIPKTRIGNVTGNGPWCVFLLEDDFIKARTLILDYVEKDERYTYIIEQMKGCLKIYDRARKYEKKEEN